MNTSAISAFLFFQEYKDDPNFLASPEEVEFWRQQGIIFHAAVSELLCELPRLSLTGDSKEDETIIQTLFYDVGKRHFGEGKKELRNWFKYLYYSLYETANGARFGVIVQLLTADDFSARLRARLEKPFGF